MRAGLIAYACVHLLIAYVALRLAFGHSSNGATGKGALEQLAGDTLGEAALGLMALGFAALVLWQVITGLVGYRDQHGWKRALMRFGAGARAVTYGYFAVECAKLAIGGRSAGGGSADSTTAKVMALPAGPFLVAAAGATTAGIGIGLAVFGWRAGFMDQLDRQARREQRRTPIVLLGRIGYIVKGAAFVVIGVLLGWAAVQHRPQRTGGLDQALREVLGQSLGMPALVVVGLGIGCFGVFLLVRSRHLDSGSLTS